MLLKLDLKLFDLEHTLIQLFFQVNQQQGNGLTNDLKKVFVLG